MPTTYGFTGQHSDSATGLDYYNARYYDPASGRFTSADTVLPGGGYDPSGLDRYAYVEENPETHTDPNGHCFLVCAAIGAALGLAAGIATQVQKGTLGSPSAWVRTATDAVMGATAGAMIGDGDVGAMVGFAVGAAGGLLAVHNGKATLQEAFEGAAINGIVSGLGGAAGGAVTKAFGLNGIAGVAGGLVRTGVAAVNGAVQGTVSSLATQTLDGNGYDWGNVGWSALIDGGISGLGQGISEFIPLPGLPRTLNRGSRALNRAATQAAQLARRATRNDWTSVWTGLGQGATSLASGQYGNFDPHPPFIRLYGRGGRGAF